MVTSSSFGHVPSHRLAWVGSWLSFLLVSCLVTACGKPVAPLQSLEDLHVRSQERLFAEAKRTFLAAQYPRSIDQLQRFLSTYSESELKWDVTWLLARAYHLSGETTNARQLYQQVLRHEKAHAFHQEAKEYLTHLQPVPKPIIREQSKVFAFQMTLGQWLRGQDWNARLKNMMSRGVTTQLINVECGLKKQEAMLLFSGTPTVQPIRSDVTPNFTAFVQQAHQQGMTVFLGVNIRCLGSLGDNPSPQWMDRAYDHSTQTIRSTQYFDVFNPGYQKFVKNVLVQLMNLGVDGIVFLGDAPMGMFDGLTPVALRKFEKAFGAAFSPKKVFRESLRVGRPKRKIVLPKASTFWRWAGWRARVRLNVLEDFSNTLRSKDPRIQVALEIYAGSLNDPLKTLLRFNEDILESQNRDFSFFLVDVDGPTSNGTASQESLHMLAKRILEVTKDPTKIWLTIPRKMEVKTWSSESLQDLTRGMHIPQGIGLVYDLRPLS